MAQTTILGRNITFPIYNADGTPFNDLVLKKATVESIVMSLGDKISGDVYYKDNQLNVTMSEYIEYNANPDDENSPTVKYYLVNPPTIVREGMVADNSQLKGTTKYSFVFYHPMYMLGNFPFTDIAVTGDERKYLSQNKTFSWIGTLYEFVAKLNANLNNTEWIVTINIAQSDVEQLQKANKLSEVLSFDKQFICDALKKAYEEWEIPFTITSIRQDEQHYAQGKRFLIEFGLPTQEIYADEEHLVPFVFRFGQGIGLKNNSRTPRNNKIVTRLCGYGSERNVPFGYPQIIWTGDQTWEYTINNDASAPNSYPIYTGIVGGQPVRLIKHPFTRSTLMPSIYTNTVNKKVNPYAQGYDPDTEIVDYYDASDASVFPNPINPLAPSVEIHEFEDIYPRLNDAEIISATPYDAKKINGVVHAPITTAAFNALVQQDINNARNENEKAALRRLYNALNNGGSATEYTDSYNGGAYTFDCRATKKDGLWLVLYTSDNVNYDYLVGSQASPTWDDTMNDEGEYVQSYFKIRLPQLTFDVYASAAITQEMTINMRSGRCLGCSFPVQVDWDDYKQNFYDKDGNFAPDGLQRDLTKYPNSANGSIEVIVQKDLDTFGTLMPNIYQQPQAGDKFVFLGISLPIAYITNAEIELDSAMTEYLLENNVYYFDYPLKFDEHFFAINPNILKQVKNNNIVRFVFAGISMALYIKQITIKYGERPLPQYEITLTDDVEIVLNKIGQVTDDVSRMRVQLSELQKYYSDGVYADLAEKLSRIDDDICQGRITFQQGLDAVGDAIFHGELRSPQYETGTYTGRGWRIDQLGNAEMESMKVRSFFEVVQMLVNRMEAQEGDTLYSDNDQIDKVERKVDETDGSVSYVLSLKEKFDGYFTSQMFNNVVKGTINTLAAKQAGISDEEHNNPQKQGSDDGGNKYYTSWMRVIGTQQTDNTLDKNQIRVVLYGDNEVPSQKNFEPCELMTIARVGCVRYGDPSDVALQESITRRQRYFMISTSEGRVVKYTGVDSPMLLNGNYGVTIGELPEFVKNYPDVRSILDVVGEHTDWVYAQGIVVGNYVKVDREGLPIPVTVFCGEWIDGSQVVNPQVGKGKYYYNQYNEETQQNETHEVRHNGGRWQCLQSQPVTIGGVETYFEPKWNSPYWLLVDGNDNLTIEFVSSKGYSFRRGAVDTIITPHLFYGNVDITDDIAAEYWSWERESESGKTEQDVGWDALHEEQKTLHLTNLDMPSTWSSHDKAIFTCKVTVIDGKSTIIVENQIIS